MKKHTIAEYYTLPSHGKVYEKTVNPDIKLSSMTTEHEMRRLSPNTNSEYKNLCDIIDDCIVTEDVGISSYDMCLGDYLFLLQKLRVVTYGSDYKISTYCDKCGSENKYTINLDEVELLEYDDTIVNAHSEFTLPKTGKVVKLKLKTPRMMDKIRQDVLKFKEKSGSNLDPSIAYLILHMIDTVDGKPLSIVDGLDWVRKLPLADSNAILQHSDKLNNSIGVNLVLTNKCNTCGLKFKTMLRMNNEFFRPALD